MTLSPRLALVSLIGANLFPIIGVFLFGWSVASILVLYWLESVIIGVLNIPKIWACKGGLFEKLFLTPFFTFHYGMFCFGHATFIAEIFDGQVIFDGLRDGGPLLWTALSFLVSHVVSMLVNFFGRKEYVGRECSTQMFMPYGRIVILHIVILFGGFLVQISGEPIIALILLVVLKTGIDVAVHKKSHADSLRV